MGSTEQVNTKELVRAALEGDNSAYEALYNSTVVRMTGLARSMLRQEEDALDVLQESYLYAFQSLDSLRQPEYFGTWLYRIVSNRCKNFLTRTRPKLFAGSLTDQEGDDWEITDEDLSFQPEEQADDAETRRIVWEMVDSLPEDQRVCVLLYYFQEMKVAEIAQLLELSENTVKSRLGYARKKLRSKAEELERRGTVLHGVAFLPLLGLAAKQAAAQTVSDAGQIVFHTAMAELGGAAAAGGATGGAATAAAASAPGGKAAGVKGFLATAKGKGAAGAAVVLAAAGIVALNWAPEPRPAPEPVPIASQPQPESEPQPRTEPQSELQPEPQSQPEPQPGPEQPADGFYTVTVLFQNRDGTPLNDARALGFRLGGYTVVVDDQHVPAYKSTYSEYESGEGQTIITSAEAEAMGLLQSMSYTDASLVFTTSERYYYVCVAYSNSGGGNVVSGKGSTSKQEDHTVVIGREGARTDS